MSTKTPSIAQFALVILVLWIGHVSDARSQKSLHGPIIVGLPVGNNILTVEDVGTGQVREIALSQPYSPTYNWSPDGCYLLMRGSQTWDIISITDLGVQHIEEESPVGVLTESIASPLWHPSSKFILFSISANPGYLATQFYAYDLAAQKSSHIFSVSENAHSVRWLSETEFLYEAKGRNYVWHQSTGQSDSFPAHVDLQPSSKDWILPFYVLDSSEDGLIWSRYFDVRAFYTAKSAKGDDSLEDVYGPLDDIVPKTGFDIFDVVMGQERHIALYDRFVQSLAVSPSGEYVAITTLPLTSPEDRSDIFIYNLETDTSMQVSDNASVPDSEYGSYQPAWSPDERWLAFYTPSGYIIYDRSKKQSFPLAAKFNDSYLRLSWSPSMKYLDGQCSSSSNQ